MKFNNCITKISKCFLITFACTVIYTHCFATEQPTIKNKYIRKGTDTEIFFIHGFGGDATIWQNAKTQFYWPKAVFDDNTHSNVTVLNIGNCGEHFLLEKIMDVDNTNSQHQDHLYESTAVADALAKSVEATKRIIIISHSVGGVFVLDAVQMLKKSKPEVYHKISDIFLISTPLKDVDLQNILSNLGTQTCSRSNLPTFNVNNSYSKELLKEWHAISTGKEPSPHIHSVYETTRFLRLAPLATKENIYPYSHEAPRAIPNTNHFSIVQPESREAPIYEWVNSFLLIKNK
jgi:pimeloyl-ACP methyl ester carboxylesterase